MDIGSENYTVDTLNLAVAIINDIEISRDNLELLCLKASRLALLLNDVETSDKFSQMAERAGEAAAYFEVIEPNIDLLLEEDPNSILREPFARLLIPSSTVRKQREIRKIHDHKHKHKTSSIRVSIYKYALNVYHKIRFSSIPQTVFSRVRMDIDQKLTIILPEHKEKFFSVYKNIESANPEDWSNAVHSCRRILQALADTLYPPKDGEVIKIGGKDIKIGKEQYINRLMIYIESKSDSGNFKSIVGSHLNYIGERLDAVYKSANKGSHETISLREEAERYITYTYLLIGDIISL